MGMSPIGKLIYGYALGNQENGYRIAEVDEDGNWQTPWAIALRTDESRQHEDPDPTVHIVSMLRTAGMDAGDAYSRNSIRLAHYGHLEYGHSLALVTYEAKAEWSEVAPVDVAALEIARQAQGWDDLLTQAVNVLGITPITENNNPWDGDTPRVPVPPRWMVVAQYI